MAPKRPIPSPPYIGKAYSLVERFTYIPAVTINSVPFTFNRKIRRFAVSWTSLKYKIWLGSMLFMVFVELAQITKELVQALPDPRVSRGDWCLTMFLFISWQFVLAAHVNAFIHGDEIVNHLNQLIRAREWFTKDHRQLPASKDHKVVTGFLWCCAAQLFFQCLTVAANGATGPHLYSNVPEEYRNMYLTAVWAVYAYYRVMSNFGTALWHYLSGSLQVQVCTQVLEWR